MLSSALTSLAFCFNLSCSGSSCRDRDCVDKRWAGGGWRKRKNNSVTKAVKDYTWKLFLNFSRKWGISITPTEGNGGKQLLEIKSFSFLNVSVFEKGIPFFCFVKDSKGVARQLCLKCNHNKTQITHICELNYILCIWTKESDLYFLEQFLPLLGNQALTESRSFCYTYTHRSGCRLNKVHLSDPGPITSATAHFTEHLQFLLCVTLSE